MTGVGNILEPMFAGVSLLCYAAYHLFLWGKVRHSPMSTTIGHNHEVRRIWCEIVKKERRDILAVQTIRNTLMSSSLLASTSLTLSAVVAAYLVNTISASGLLGLDILSSEYIKPVHKFFAVILCFTVAFYCYMQSVRASNHAGYLLGLPPDDLMFPPSYAARVIRRGADFHTAGTRIFYLAFLCVIWIFGPIPLLVLTMLLIPHLWYLDRASEQRSFSLQSEQHKPQVDAGASDPC